MGTRLILLVGVLFLVGVLSPQFAAPLLASSGLTAFTIAGDSLAKAGGNLTTGIVDFFLSNAQGLELSLLIVGGGSAGLVSAVMRRRPRS